jgi:hypothetical protein
MAADATPVTGLKTSKIDGPVKRRKSDSFVKSSSCGAQISAA